MGHKLQFCSSLFENDLSTLMKMFSVEATSGEHNIKPTVIVISSANLSGNNVC